MNTRATTPSSFNQGVDEKIAYRLTTTPWGSSPSNVVVAAKDLTNNSVVVTSTVFPTNSPSASGDIITLSLLQALTNNHLYRIEIKFDVGGNTLECYFEVQAQT